MVITVVGVGQGHPHGVAVLIGRRDHPHKVVVVVDVGLDTPHGVVVGKILNKDAL